MQRTYSQCPKCGHRLPQPLPETASCPCCGIYFFKYATPSAPRIEKAPESALLAPLDDLGRASFYGRIAAFVLLASWSWVLFAYDYRDGEMGASFMHLVLLPIHEAGHVFFMPFGEFMHILGGSLFQLLLPFGIGAAFFLKNRDNFGAALGMWWGGASLLDLSPYIYDSLHPQLILLGGHTGEDGPHDWIYLLTALGQLGNAQKWGAAAHALGGIVVFSALAWALAVLWKQKSKMKPAE
jgi:hypothetical protein